MIRKREGNGSPTLNYDRLQDPENISSSTDNDENSSESFTKPTEWGSRHSMAICAFWGFAASYAMRVNLSIAIVSMVNSSSIIPSPAVSNISVCSSLLAKPAEINSANGNLQLSQNALLADKEGEFNWDSEDQGIILGSFFWGYVATQIPGAMLAERIGGKWPFGIGMLITALFSLVTPAAARYGKNALIIVRVIQGLGEGVTNPSMHFLLSKWTPPLERSKIAAFVYTGTQIGTVLAMPISGYLISSSYDWPSVFYFFGMFGIIWFIFWCYLVFDTPQSHPRISSQELAYIQNSIGSQTSKHKVPTPWKKIFTSWPVFAILIAQTGHGWGLYSLLTELPTYLKTILHFDIKNNATLSALPYLAMWVVSIISGNLSDWLREHNICSTTTARKIFNSIGHFGSAIFLIMLTFAGCNRFWAVTLIVCAVGINGSAWASFQVNHIDIAPNHAALLMGICNMFANICGIASPYYAGMVINKYGVTLNAWEIIFFTSAAIYVFDNIIYMLFASGEVQSWNKDPLSESKETEEEEDPLLSSAASTSR